ncbi:MAG: HesA/MoeB/ThiF family protein [Rhodospirillales bacterium]
MSGFGFREDQIERYARHILLREIGGAGQKKLLDARVLMIGAGGLGSPAAIYLAAAGVGTLGVCDDDAVDLSNLQRQIAHTTARIGAHKVDSAAETVAALNPDVKVIPHKERLSAENAARIIADYDIIADGSDNFETRFLVNDACYFADKTLVSAAILRFDGQLAVFKPHAQNAHGEAYPCYRCIFREAPPPGQTPSCAEAGVLGALCGVMGSLQAAEVIKEITGAGETHAGALTIFDGLSTRFRRVDVRRDPGCPLCGDAPTITDLTSHAA